MRLDLTKETDRLKCAQLLFVRFCEDLKEDGAKARTRLVAGIQVALGQAADNEPIDWSTDQR